MIPKATMKSYDPDDAPALHTAAHAHVRSDPAPRVRALESLLVEKGLLDPEAIEARLEVFRDEMGLKHGAGAVARAWADPAFRDRLLADATAAMKELGIESWAIAPLKAVENTAETHNLVVCTLCSCYPRGLLGLQPSWYKKAADRALAVREPRAVLAEFGVALGPEVAVKVWGSTAELRDLVLLQRPAGTEDWDEAALAALVTRNSMIGTERDLPTWREG
ncbi:MAG: nitrile hydratase subunit alpha [Pseudomonadota bacterium]